MFQFLLKLRPLIRAFKFLQHLHLNTILSHPTLPHLTRRMRLLISILDFQESLEYLVILLRHLKLIIEARTVLRTITQLMLQSPLQVSKRQPGSSSSFLLVAVSDSLWNIILILFRNRMLRLMPIIISQMLR